MDCDEKNSLLFYVGNPYLNVYSAKKKHSYLNRTSVHNKLNVERILVTISTQYK